MDESKEARESEDGHHPFFPASRFSVFEQAWVTKPLTLGFVDAALISRNHSHPKWASFAPRRLKNVIVTMDWMPAVASQPPVRR